MRSFHCTPPAPPISSTSAWRCVRKTAKFKATKTNAARAKIRPRRLSRRLQARTAKTRASEKTAAKTTAEQEATKTAKGGQRAAKKMAKKRGGIGAYGKFLYLGLFIFCFCATLLCIVLFALPHTYGRGRLGRERVIDRGKYSYYY